MICRFHDAGFHSHENSCDFVSSKSFLSSNNSRLWSDNTELIVWPVPWSNDKFCGVWLKPTLPPIVPFRGQQRRWNHHLAKGRFALFFLIYRLTAACRLFLRQQCCFRHYAVNVIFLLSTCGLFLLMAINLTWPIDIIIKFSWCYNK